MLPWVYWLSWWELAESESRHGRSWSANVKIPMPPFSTLRAITASTVGFECSIPKYNNNDNLFLHLSPSGIVGCALLLGSVLSGLPLYFINGGFTLKTLHRFFGLTGFLALMVSQMFGYNTGFGKRQWKPHHQKLFKFFTFIATITTANYEFRRFVRDIAGLATNYFIGSDSAEAKEDL